MSHPYNRPESALDRTATIIQEARRGEITAHEAAERVFACLGLSVTAPLPPSPTTSKGAEQGKQAARGITSPLPPPPSISHSALTPVLDRIFGAASAIMKMSDLGEAKRYAERILSWREWFTEQDAPLSEIDCNPQSETRGIREAAELLRANGYMVGKVVRKLPPVYAIPPAPRYATAIDLGSPDGDRSIPSATVNGKVYTMRPGETPVCALKRVVAEMRAENDKNLTALRQQLADSEIERASMVPRVEWQKLADEVADLRRWKRIIESRVGAILV